MCAIIGSFDRKKLAELIKLNSYRGSHSYSVSTIDTHGNLEIHTKSLGVLIPDLIPVFDGYYYIVHIQAPTTDAKSSAYIHPATEWFTCLWHNGIIKADHVKKMQARFGEDTNWDTELVLRAINTSRDELNLIDGSFSCLWYDGAGAHLFRNSISPMFYDSDLNISSTKFEGSISTPADKILRMDFESRALYNVGDFKTVENPYFFGDDN